MENSLEFLYLITRDDMYLRIGSSIKIRFCLRIDLVTVELQSWDREKGIGEDIASCTDDFPSFI